MFCIGIFSYLLSTAFVATTASDSTTTPTAGETCKQPSYYCDTSEFPNGNDKCFTDPTDPDRDVWDYLDYSDSHYAEHGGGHHWGDSDACSDCKRGKKYSSPIAIDENHLKTRSQFKADAGYELEPIFFSFPYKYGYHVANSYRLINKRTIEILIPDGTDGYNGGYDDMDNHNWTVIGGALHHKAFCLKKVQIHFGKKLYHRRRMAGGHSTPDDYTYEGAEHVFTQDASDRAAAEVQFWTYDCGMTWREAYEEPATGQNYSIAVFSVIYYVDDDIPTYGQDRRRLAGGPRFPPNEDKMYKKSWYKIASYYVGNEAHTTDDDATGVQAKVLKCFGNCKTMEYSDHEKDMYIDLHELLPPQENWNNYYFYKGGFTQPPCTPKKVKWHIMKAPDAASKMIINKYLLYKFHKYVNAQTADEGVKLSWREIQNYENFNYPVNAEFEQDEATAPKVYFHNAVACPSAVVALLFALASLSF